MQFTVNLLFIPASTCNPPPPSGASLMARAPAPVVRGRAWLVPRYALLIRRVSGGWIIPCKCPRDGPLLGRRWRPRNESDGDECCFCRRGYLRLDFQGGGRREGGRVGRKWRRKRMRRSEGIKKCWRRKEDINSFWDECAEWHIYDFVVDFECLCLPAIWKRGEKLQSISRSLFNNRNSSLGAEVSVADALLHLQITWLCVTVVFRKVCSLL